LGHGGRKDEAKPRAVAAFTERAVCVSAGLEHMAVVGVSGRVWTWGCGRDGRLGHGVKKAQEELPRLVEGVRGVSVSAGSYHTVLLGADGRAFSWGNGSFGKLGHGSRESELRPREMRSGAAADARIAAVSASFEHTVLLAADGGVLICGSGVGGSLLGLGASEDSLVPTRMENLPKMAAVSAGASHTLAMTGDGHVWSWGSGAEGKLGNGSEDAEEVPRRVEGVEGAVAISACAAHSAVVLADGRVAAFGRSAEGALGRGCREREHSPVIVQGLKDVVCVAVGGGIANRQRWGITTFIDVHGQVLTMGGGEAERFLGRARSEKSEDRWCARPVEGIAGARQVGTGGSGVRRRLPRISHP